MPSSVHCKTRIQQHAEWSGGLRTRVASVCRPATLLPCRSSVIAKQPATAACPRSSKSRYCISIADLAYKPACAVKSCASEELGYCSSWTDSGRAWQAEGVNVVEVLPVVCLSAKVDNAAAPQTVLHAHLHHLRRRETLLDADIRGSAVRGQHNILTTALNRAVECRRKRTHC